MSFSWVLRDNSLVFISAGVWSYILLCNCIYANSMAHFLVLLNFLSLFFFSDNDHNAAVREPVHSVSSRLQIDRKLLGPQPTTNRDSTRLFTTCKVCPEQMCHSDLFIIQQSCVRNGKCHSEHEFDEKHICLAVGKWVGWGRTTSTVICECRSSFKPPKMTST